MKVSRSLMLLTGGLILAALSPVRADDDAAPEPAVKTPEGPFFAKPYLQIGRAPSPDALQLLWHAPDDDAAWSVEYRNGAAAPWRKAETPVPTRVAVGKVQPHRIFRAALTGLTPGGTFEYRVSRGDKALFTAEARAPKSADQPYRFVAFGDCGAGTKEQKPLAERAFLAKPDLVVIPGDIVYERGQITDYWTKFWPVYNADEPSAAGAPLLRSIPFVAAPGNHDTDTRDLDKYPDALAYFLFWDQPRNGPPGVEGNAFVPMLKATEANRRAFADAAGDAYPGMTNFSFDYGNAHWTIVDSNPYVDWTDKDLKAWVAKDLEAAKGATWKFVAFHHPGFNSSREHYEQQHMRLLAPTFEAGKVDIVFNGHVHNYQRSYPMKFVPDKLGTLLVGGKDNKTIRGRVVNGDWTLDKTFDGKADTTPEGVIYVVTGAGGQKLYNPEQQGRRDTFQGFTDKFVSKAHSLTVADVDGKTLTVRQLNAAGEEIDRFVITK